MKRWVLLLGSAVLLSFLLWQGTVTSQGVQQGLLLCARSVIPALFPFMVAVRFAVACGLGQSLPPAFSAFAVGAVGGYPLGAATVEQLYEKGQLTRSQAAGLLCCCNNAGPAFILTFLGQGVFGSIRTGLTLWVVHLLSAIIMAILFFPASKAALPSAAPPKAPAAAFVEAVTGGVETTARICGFVVTFSVVTALLTAFGMESPLLLGALELTCGGGYLPHTTRGFLTAATLLGWGGLSVHCQTAAVLSDTDLPLRRYVSAKALQSAISAVLALAAIAAGVV